jgi:hypothetical protein
LRRQPSLRSQLNQIRLWVRQGRTDAWIAHKLDVSIEQLERFKRDHSLVEGSAPARPADPLSVPPPEPADYTELDEEPEEEPAEEPAAEREAELEEDEEVAAAEPAPTDTLSDDNGGRPAREASDDGGDEDVVPRRRRRRGRRGGRRRRRPSSYEATFDHGEEGYGLWLDPAVVDNPIYAQHWAGHRAVVVTVDPDSITIRRASATGDAEGEAEEAEEA